MEDDNNHMDQPKGYTDNRRKHVQKIDAKGNLKPHPRTAKPKANTNAPKLTNMQKLMRHNKALGDKHGYADTTTNAPPVDENESGIRKVVKKVKANVKDAGRRLNTIGEGLTGKHDAKSLTGKVKSDAKKFEKDKK